MARDGCIYAAVEAGRVLNIDSTIIHIALSETQLSQIVQNMNLDILNLNQNGAMQSWVLMVASIGHLAIPLKF